VEGEKTNEHLDNLVRGVAVSVDRRLYCVPRCWCVNPLVARLCGYLADPAFCDGQTYSLTKPPVADADSAVTLPIHHLARLTHQRSLQGVLLTIGSSRSQDPGKHSVSDAVSPRCEEHSRTKRELACQRGAPVKGKLRSSCMVSCSDCGDDAVIRRMVRHGDSISAALAAPKGSEWV
jgi:hypothetical protein